MVLVHRIYFVVVLQACVSDTVLCKPVNNINDNHIRKHRKDNTVDTHLDDNSSGSEYSGYSVSRNDGESGSLSKKVRTNPSKETNQNTIRTVTQSLDVTSVSRYPYDTKEETSLQQDIRDTTTLRGSTFISVYIKAVTPTLNSWDTSVPSYEPIVMASLSYKTHEATLESLAHGSQGGKDSKNSTNVTVVIVVSASVAVCIGLVVVCVNRRKRKRNISKERNDTTIPRTLDEQRTDHGSADAQGNNNYFVLEPIANYESVEAIGLEEDDQRTRYSEELEESINVYSNSENQEDVYSHGNALGVKAFTRDNNYDHVDVYDESINVYSNSENQEDIYSHGNALEVKAFTRDNNYDHVDITINTDTEDDTYAHAIALEGVKVKEDSNYHHIELEP